MNAPNALSRLLRLETVLVVAFAAIAAAAVLRPATTASEPSKVATVDLEKVFTSLKRYESGLAKLKTLGETLEA
ncbi:MAG: hypothetical protein RIT24_2685, partial [Planctomycetota bacterium]